jgi:type IV secretion/conjugal transfer VirB4 family ATPase
MRIPAIAREYQQAGAFNEVVGPLLWVAEGVFLTKAGDVGMVLRLDGPDYESLDHPERDHVARRFEAALRTFDEHFRVYQYLIKRPCREIPHEPSGVPLIDDASQRRLRLLTGGTRPLYHIDTHAVILHQGWYQRQSWRDLGRRFSQTPVQTLRDVVSAGQVLHVVDTALDRAIRTLRYRVETFVAQTQGNANATMLGTVEAFSFLRGLVNYDPVKAQRVRATADTFVDFALPDSHLECHRGYLRLDDHYLKVLTLKQPPPQTFAHALDVLYQAPANFVVVSEWRVESAGRIRREIHAKRRHFHNSKTSIMNYMSGTPTTASELLIDDAAAAMVDDLGTSLKELELHGKRFGLFSLTAVCFDEDQSAVDRHVNTLAKAFSTRDIPVVEEQYNLLNAWLATIPGNHARNLRTLYVLDTNYADLSFAFSLYSGERTNPHLDREYLAVLETHHTPFFLNLHVDEVGHSLVFGATGAGKSFFVSFLLAHLQKYRPRTVVFDLGGSYRRLIERLGGSYLHLGLEERAFTINPFALPPTKEHLHFLYTFVRVLIESSGQYVLTLHDARDLYEQITNLYTIDSHNRRLFTLRNILSRTLADHLTPWVQGGPYAELFDHAEDTLTCLDCQYFDFEGLERYPQMLEPLLFYVLHRASSVVYDPVLRDILKVFVVDEAWRFLKNPTIKEYVGAALKTWRKRNALMLLAMQSADDLRKVELLRTAVESAPSVFLLANPGMDRAAYRELFGLNELELDTVASLAMRREIFLKRTAFSKVLRLDVDPESAALFSTGAPSRLTETHITRTSNN